MREKFEKNTDRLFDNVNKTSVVVRGWIYAEGFLTPLKHPKLFGVGVELLVDSCAVASAWASPS